MRALTAILVSLALLLGCATPPAERREVEPYPPAETGGMRISVDFDRVDLAEAMKQISEQVGREIVVDPLVDETVSVRLTDIPWREAVEVIALMSRCEVVERDGVLRLQQCTIIKVDFEDADVRVVLQLLAAYQGKEILLPGELQGKVDVHLDAVDGAIQTVFDQVGGYRVVHEDDVLLRVVAKESGPR